MTPLRPMISRSRDVLDAFAPGGPAIRTHSLLERAFPAVLWGISTPDDRSPIHLSFDDGPSPRHTPALLDLLAHRGVRSTFFVRGDRWLRHPKLVEQIRAAGHHVGYHGFTHRPWWGRTTGSRRTEMDPEIVERLQPGLRRTLSPPLLLRAPYGQIDWATVTTARDLEARLVHFRLAVRDWIPDQRASSVARRILRSVLPGDIVVLHDGSPASGTLVDALDLAIPALRHSGLSISSIQPFLRND